MICIEEEPQLSAVGADFACNARSCNTQTAESLGVRIVLPTTGYLPEKTAKCRKSSVIDLRTIQHQKYQYGGGGQVIIPTPPPPCQKNLADRGRSARAPCDIYRRTRHTVAMLYGFPRIRCCLPGRKVTPPLRPPQVQARLRSRCESCAPDASIGHSGAAQILTGALPTSCRLSPGAVRPLLSYLLPDFANCRTFLRATRAERVVQQEPEVSQPLRHGCLGWPWCQCMCSGRHRGLVIHRIAHRSGSTSRVASLLFSGGLLSRTQRKSKHRLGQLIGIRSRRSSTKEMDGAVRQLGSEATPSAPHPACSWRQ